MVDPIVLRIAKTAILEQFDPQSYKIDKAALLAHYPFLAKEGAAFVTLNHAKALRGCIGSIVAHRQLLEDIIHNAKAAAFSDPRFDPLKEEEIDEHFMLEVSILSKPQLVEYSDYEDLKSKITPFKDGLILRYDRYQGTFLPQVWEQLPKVEQFLEHLSYKAGANPTIYAHHPQIYRYRVEHIKEAWHAIRAL